MKQVINQNVNYANHTNSSAPSWDSNSASSMSLSTIIRDKILLFVGAARNEPSIDNEIANKSLHTDVASATLHLMNVTIPDKPE